MVHSICCLAGSASLIDDVRAELRADGIATAIRRHDTATLFDWLMAALSYQGISNRVAAAYMEQHGSATWADIDQKAGQGVTCPRLTSYWHFYDCGYAKISGTCSEPDHIDGCPLPTHQLRNGRLNQMAYSLSCSFAILPVATWSLDRPAIPTCRRPSQPQSARPIAGSCDWTAPGGLWRLRQGPDHEPVVHPAGRP